MSTTETEISRRRSKELLHVGRGLKLLECRVAFPQWDLALPPFVFLFRVVEEQKSLGFVLRKMVDGSRCDLRLQRDMKIIEVARERDSQDPDPDSIKILDMDGCILIHYKLLSGAETTRMIWLFRKYPASVVDAIPEVR